MISVAAPSFHVETGNPLALAKCPGVADRMPQMYQRQVDELTTMSTEAFAAST